MLSAFQDIKREYITCTATFLCILIFFVDLAVFTGCTNTIFLLATLILRYEICRRNKEKNKMIEGEDEE